MKQLSNLNALSNRNKVQAVLGSSPRSVGRKATDYSLLSVLHQKPLQPRSQGTFWTCYLFIYLGSRVVLISVDEPPKIWAIILIAWSVHLNTRL
jgi:hypothetical protein